MCSCVHEPAVEIAAAAAVITALHTLQTSGELPKDIFRISVSNNAEKIVNSDNTYTIILNGSSSEKYIRGKKDQWSEMFIFFTSDHMYIMIQIASGSLKDIQAQLFEMSWFENKEPNRFEILLIDQRDEKLGHTPAPVHALPLDEWPNHPNMIIWSTNTKPRFMGNEAGGIFRVWIPSTEEHLDFDGMGTLDIDEVQIGLRFSEEKKQISSIIRLIED